MIVVTLGTRPEAIKLAPVVRALRTRGVEVRVVLTGQHTTLLDGTLAADLADGAVALNLPSDGNVTRWETKAIAKLAGRFAALAPTAVVVQGDVMSAAAAAEAAVGADLPLVHVEAGVRSGNASEPWPEEQIRRHISTLAEVHYCATHTALRNLEREQVRGVKVVTGNPVVTALHDAGATLLPSEGHVVVTLHRRELRLRADAFDVLTRLLMACGRDAPGTRFVWPVHPAMRPLVATLTVPPNVFLIDPLGYDNFLPLLASARGVITDSGGVTEEAATLGIPTAILRDANDRPEAEQAGVARAVPLSHSQQAVPLVVSDTLTRSPTAAFGGREAADRIATHLAGLLEKGYFKA